MNCLKSIYYKKEFGLSYLRSLAIILSLVSFIIFYLILSVFHGSHIVKDTGFFIFLIAVALLPFFHIFSHILPLIIMKGNIKLIISKRVLWLPSCTYSAKSYLTKKVSLTKAFSPTIFITLPTIIASFYFQDYYVFFALYTSLSLGLSLRDFIYIQHVIKAPKKALIEDSPDGFSVLLSSNN